MTLVISVTPSLGYRNSGRTAKALPHPLQAIKAAHRDNELLVRFRGDQSEQQKDLIAGSHGMRRQKSLRGPSGIEKLKLLSSVDVETAAQQLMLDQSTEFAEPNFLVNQDQLGTVPNDPRFNEQWSLRNIGQSGGQFGSDIEASDAWQTTSGATNVVMAIVDSGIDFTHPDLLDNQWVNNNPTNGDLHGWDFVEDSAVIKDEEGHGTAVTGILAASGNNGVGVSGVMWHASVMSLRVLDKNGTGDVAAAVEAIDYATSHGAQVINLSWGTTGNSVSLSQAITRAIARGVVVVCSAGNSSQDLDNTPYYPASFKIPNLIAVAATDGFDQLTSFSNWGKKSTSVAAPGVNILTTQRGGDYWLVSGTSAAAPLVSGIAGLLKTFRPSANPALIARAISDGARPIASLSGKVSSGAVASAAGALEKLRGSSNQVLPFAPRGIGSGGTGPGGTFSTMPPPTTSGAPGVNLPNLDEIPKGKPQQPKTQAPIESNLMCADCDPQGGGGGGGYYPSGDPNFSTARRRPMNETGDPGVDLGSRNFNWSLPLVSLPGRAGLDVNLTLFYNSLVWTKDGSNMKFNADLGSPAPGFRLGLPILQQRFLNSQTGIYAYLMVTPSGSRVELRQVGSSNIYESQDSSYTQLDVSTANAPVVRTTDGTQFTFTPVTNDSEFRCSQIKDRNGNYISATYNTTTGHLLNLTDTLGRVVSFIYDLSDNLVAIRQTWNGTAHDWATFNYVQVHVQPLFGGGLLINGPSNNDITVLAQVNLQDGNYFTFNYNTAFGQVNRINHYASDGRLREYSSYNVDSSSGQTECPRFTERRDWAENWNGDTNDVPTTSEEAVTSFTVAGDGSWTQQTSPDSTIYKEFFATSGWQSGLTTLTEIWSGGVKKKWTTIAWTQDDTGLSYQKNPRVSETNIYDAEGNRRRTTISYYPTTSFSLPSDVYEYAADATTVLRRSHTNYQLSTSYTNRRIIGLPLGNYIYDGNNTLYKFDVFDYDYGGGALIDTPQPAFQHDSAYGLSFLTGRGNLSLIRHVDVTDPANTWTNTVLGYNTSGSLVSITDPLWRQTTLSYSDSFSDAVNRNTFAYPTTVTDPDGFSSTTQYNFDFGSVTRAQGPPPAGQTQGLIRTLTYDSAARVERVTVTNTGAYTRYIYGTYYQQSFSSVNNAGDDAYSCQILDGAGRVTGQSANHPGSTGGYIGQLTNYDVMGRAVQQTNPTEISGSWAPIGDDSAGWVWTSQAYDWESRPTLTTLPDGNTRENIYGGCGCAGGEVTTVRDEQGRRKRYTKDVFGRSSKVEELNWDQTVYATTNYTYNVRDQLTNINQAGQTRSLAYDGYGRLQSRTTPEQGTTTYSYLANDNVQTITDARGATTTLGYNNRNLVTSLTYGVSGSVAATPNVSFGYDAAGNRTSMTDGLGSVSYVYDQLSRLTSETRTFTGVGSYQLSYGYNLSGELNSITNPWNAQVGYTYDNVGRPASVTGSGYAGVSSYLSSFGYRAFGLKQMNYGNGRTLSLQYDNRLRPTLWSVPGVLRMQYQYLWEQSGRLEFARNLDDETLDRWFAYDSVGRLIVSRSGNEARIAIGEQVPLLYNGPYSHGYQYDQWGNITYREGWGGDNPSYTVTYTNNKRSGLTYDAAGNVTNDGGQNFTYDATGQAATASGYLLQQYYDGDGVRVKKTDNGATTYYLRSSVLGGQVVAEITWSGSSWQWSRGYVYLGGELIATQQQSAVYWVHQDPLVKSKRVTNSSGTVVSTVELDPWGGNTNRNSNDAFQPHKFTNYERDGNASDEAMFRRYNRWWSRFDQPDPYAGSYDMADPQSFNRYGYVQNDPVNFIDPSGLVSQEDDGLDPTKRLSGSGWGGIIGAFIFGGVVTQTYSFYDDNRLFTISWFWSGGWLSGPQQPVPQPHPSPTPAPTQNSKNFWKCMNGWKFSALVGDLTKGSRLQGAAQTTASILEVGAPLSTAGDAVATGYKATQTTLGQPQPYASGLNWALRRIATGPLRGALTRVGNIAGPVLSGIGAFTAGYNASVAVQCGLGVIK